MSRIKSQPDLGLHWCGSCKSLLQKENFYICKSRSTGLSNRCKSCSSANAQMWACKNKEKANKTSEIYRGTEKAKEKASEWRSKNKTKSSEYMREWRKENSYSSFTRGKARSNRAIPPWADLCAIAVIYEKAKNLRDSTGIKWHVDHKIPLNGKNVCGLHVETNLCVITASENWKKRNTFEEGLL